MHPTADENVPANNDQYNSEEDDDFDPTAVDANDDDQLSASSDSEAEIAEVATTAKKGGRKRKHVPAGIVDKELDSGDEATIQELKKSQRKKRKTGEDDDSGGEGGLIKTRAQRRAEKEEKAEFQSADKGVVTVDVASLWAKLSSAPVGRQNPEQSNVDAVDSSNKNASEGPILDRSKQSVADGINDDDDEMIVIKRTYGFAGETHTEEKRVHKSSAEAKLYLALRDKKKKAEESATGGDEHAVSTAQLRRPLRRSSAFEPNPTGEVKGLPLERQRLRAPTRADVLAQQLRKAEEDKRKGKVQKLTTVQKSAIDWAAHVDKEGLKEELDVYGRSKQGFLGRMDFIRGVEGRKESEERKARLATSAANASAITQDLSSLF
ncbi:hypothetical protein AAFC00_002643 [Neodothiora populina]|uniref:SWR1-complex protein 5 n=1 Tax=Neodothiora populina TaxID=2781224 RepID=A0ABR3P7Q3_9PEZI